MSDRDINRKVGLLGAAMVSDGRDPIETGFEMAILAQHLEEEKKRKEKREQERQKKRKR